MRQAGGIRQNPVPPQKKLGPSADFSSMQVMPPSLQGWGWAREGGLTWRTPPPSSEDRAATVRQAEP